MAHWCRGCQTSGWLLKIDNNGLCEQCSPVLVPDIVNHCRIVIESGDIVRSSKNVMTQLSRCEIAIKHCNMLLPYEQRGIPTLTMAPSEAITMFVNKREKLIDELIQQVRFEARQKATDAPTEAGKLGGYAKAVRTLDKAMVEVHDVTKLEAAILDLRAERDDLRCELLSRRAEVAFAKGKQQAAIEMLIEAMLSLKHDGTPDKAQRTRAETLRARIVALGGTPPEMTAEAYYPRRPDGSADFLDGIT